MTGRVSGDNGPDVERWRKKPVVIEAVHYDGGFPLDFLGDEERVRSAGDGSGALEIVTLEGTMRADVGDWIIRGVQGEVYPCKPDIFEATYEPVSAESLLESEQRAREEAERERDAYRLHASKGQEAYAEVLALRKQVERLRRALESIDLILPSSFGVAGSGTTDNAKRLARKALSQPTHGTEGRDG